jgi:hypothetical protein
MKEGLLGGTLGVSSKSELAERLAGQRVRAVIESAGTC